ncbi:hypothetical protein ASE00_07485 [Sphingomonas sp. Root710]|uniref:protein-glutamine glutaminase family protein n=1 Tax=Sphingomonas sp. Root710 TaxID=1736594 RepID=UPI0006FF8EAF|nr:protein-glutamine glutaminase family protein [Sphingomonas sp. Root710]KRB86532.1 hypothetical protein ASE00_07485 [Sphingomonas sp. Root710]
MRASAVQLTAFVALTAWQPAVAEPFPPTTGEFVRVEENNLLLGGMPDNPASGIATKAQIDAFFALLQAEKVEYRYVVGSCEDRAHFVAMLARKNNLPVSKIWAIAPARASLLSRQLLHVKDPLGLTSEISWGHHVAPVILVATDAAEPTAMVIDQSISPEAPIKLRDWMSALGTPGATYLVTGTNDYLFNSLNGLTVYDNGSGSPSPMSFTLPAWLPNILTGDFQKYSLQSQSSVDSVIAEGMAMNDLALAIYEVRLSVSSSDQAALKDVIKTEAAMTKLVSTGDVPSVSTAGRKSAQAFFAKRKTHWQERLTALH